MRKIAVLLIVILLGCEKDILEPEDITPPEASERCHPTSAFEGHLFNGEKTLYLYYSLEYDDDNHLARIDQYDYESGDWILSHEFAYLDGRIVHVRRGNWFSTVDYSYEYGADYKLIRTQVYDRDTGDSLSLEHEYYDPQLGGDGLYFNRASADVYELANGNFIREGSYEINGNDTTYQWFITNEFDANPNFHLSPPHLFVTHRSFLYSVATTHSANNLVRKVWPDGSEFLPIESYLYDTAGNVRSIQFAAGDIYEFEYPCVETQ